MLDTCFDEVIWSVVFTAYFLLCRSETKRIQEEGSPNYINARANIIVLYIVGMIIIGMDLFAEGCHD